MNPLFLLFDTETSGLPDFKAPHTSVSQPHLVQLAARLCTGEGTCIQSFEYLVRPDRWEIEAQATKVHGLTTQFCCDYGLSLKSVLHSFNMLCRRAHAVVAYNIQFDEMVVKAAFHRAGLASDDFDALAPLCAMKPLTQICKVPNVGRGGYKWPSLTEAHQYFFGVGFEGAHGAMTDTLAMQRVFFEMKRRQAMEAPT